MIAGWPGNKVCNHECDVEPVTRAHHLYGYLGLPGLEDEPVPVHGDHQDGEGGEEDTGGLETAQQLTDDFLKTIIYIIFKCKGWCQAIITTFGPKTQNLVMMSSMARGMVKEQRSRSEMARLAMKMFLAVSNTFMFMVYI